MVVPRHIRRARKARAYIYGTVAYQEAREKQKARDLYHDRELAFLDEKIKKLQKIKELEQK